MLLSVVIPVGNLNRDYENLRNIIKSLLTTEIATEIELVFILDTSEKFAVLKLSELCEVEKIINYKILKCSDRNPGASRNIGITSSAGKWIIFCDSDDLPIFSSIQIAMAQADSECNIIIGSFATENYLNVVTPVRLIENDSTFNWGLISLNPGIWRWLIKRNFLKFITFPELSMGEDQFFLIKLLSNRPLIKFSSESFYIYRTGTQDRLTNNKVKIRDLVKNIELEIIYVKSLKSRHNVINNMILRQLITLFKKSDFKLKLKSLLLTAKFILLLSASEYISLLKFTILISRVSYRKRNKQKVYFLHLMGGLGNQLFQVSAGLFFSISSNTPLIIDDSYGNFRKNNLGQPDILTYEPNIISTLRISSKRREFTSRILSLLIRISLKSREKLKFKITRIFLSIIASTLLSIKLKRKIKVWSATDVGFEYIPVSSKSQYLIGYFQTYRYAESSEVKSLLNNLTISTSSISEHKELAIKENPLIVHVRLGDYLQESDFGVLSAGYYDQSISLMVSKYNFNKIWVFSDEIEKAKVYIPKRFIPLCRWIDDRNDSASATLEKMRLGSGYVIGNSSFSWWGAYLSHTIKPPTIAPEPWFIGMKQPNELIPPDWIKIKR